jgi:hypothetical protein
MYLGDTMLYFVFYLSETGYDKHIAMGMRLQAGRESGKC